MESREHARVEARSQASTARRWLIGLARTALGVALLAALVFWGQIDLRALLELTPLAVVTCFAILLVSIPVAAVRWAILLRAVGTSIRVVDLLHFVAIGVLTNVLASVAMPFAASMHGARSAAAAAASRDFWWTGTRSRFSLHLGLSGWFFLSLSVGYRLVTAERPSRPSFEPSALK
jgi:hypothetical protein